MNISPRNLRKKFSNASPVSIVMALIICSVFFYSCASEKDTQTSKTIALWTFDEQQGIYPSCVLSDHSQNDFPLVLGPGGMIVEGKYGNALQAIPQPEIQLPTSKSTHFGLVKMPIPEGRSVEPLTWHNASFCALMTSGENHLRKEVGFKSPTKSQLNLGDFDWTVEFWILPTKNDQQAGVIFEIGEGPRGENDRVTSLSLSDDNKTFLFVNHSAQSRVVIPTAMVENEWQHLTFTYNAANNLLSHYINGQLFGQPLNATFSALNTGAEDYMSIGRSGTWQQPLSGKLDELRISQGLVYTADFTPPESFSYLYDKSFDKTPLPAGKPLLFAEDKGELINLGSRKHLFIDNALIESSQNAVFTVNPPKHAERVIGDIQGSFRKHLNVIEDDEGIIRMYNAVADDYLAVRISRDGVNWEIPELPDGNYKEYTNIVVHDPTGMGEVFIDPNAPLQERWKYLSGFHSRGVFLYTSPDGYRFTRKKTAVLPFWAGSQSNIFYDDQQQKYISYHRADFARGVGKATQREFVMTQTDDLIRPWMFRPSTQEEGLALAETRRVKDLLPFYLDNGLLTPGGFAFEYPNVFRPIDGFDPIDSDVYVPKATKYPWAPDVYIAFPVMYYHYKKSAPVTRSILWDEAFKRGSGPLESQLAVSRNAVDWKRYPRPAYVGIGKREGRDVHTAYMAQGMIRRGDEIWQYYFGETQYHSAHINDPTGRGVYRLIQRLDGFVSLDSPYDKEAVIITKPFIFSGNRLVLNIDTDATGFSQVGFLTENYAPIKGFTVDDCIYLNGDFISAEVQWIKNRSELEGIDQEEQSLMDFAHVSSDVAQLAGTTVRLIFKMRGSKLYSMQFTESANASME